MGVDLTALIRTPFDCKAFDEVLDDSRQARNTEEARSALTEHATRCKSCRNRLQELESSTFLLKPLSVTDLSERLERRLISQFRVWRSIDLSNLQGPSSIIRRVIDAAPEDRPRILRSLPESVARNLSTALQDLAFTNGPHEPLDAMSLSELAIEIAALDSVRESTPKDEYEDLVGRAWAILGNCRRICSDLSGATEAFELAEEHLHLGSRSPRSWAEFLNLKASLLAECLKFTEAEELLNHAIEIYSELRDPHEKARCLLSKGMVLESNSQPEVGIEYVQQALRLLDSFKEPRLLLTGKHNLIYYLKGCGRFEEALALVPETRDLHEKLGNAADLNRFCWLEGEIFLEMGDLAAAEDALLEAKQFYVQREIAYDAALVSLDLSLVYLKQQRTKELKALAREMLAIFRSLGIQREAFAALGFFRKALEIESSSTVTFVEELLEVLGKARELQEFQPRFCVTN